MIRKSLPIKFNGIKTTSTLMPSLILTSLPAGLSGKLILESLWLCPSHDLHSTIVNFEHGGCLIIPRGRDMVRLYTLLTPASSQEFDPSKVKLFSLSSRKVDPLIITVHL